MQPRLRLASERQGNAWQKSLASRSPATQAVAAQMPASGVEPATPAEPAAPAAPASGVATCGVVIHMLFCMQLAAGLSAQTMQPSAFVQQRALLCTSTPPAK